MSLGFLAIDLIIRYTIYFIVWDLKHLGITIWKHLGITIWPLSTCLTKQIIQSVCHPMTGVDVSVWFEL